MINYRIIQFSKATPPLQRAITANDNIGYIPIAPQVKDCIGTDKPTPEGKLRNDHLSFSWASNFEFCFRGQFPSKIPPQVICLRERGMGLHKNCFPKCFNTKGLWKDLHWYWYNPCLFICQNTCYQARARSVRARGACTLWALGLLLADWTPTVGGGKTFWRVSRIFLRKQL